MIWKFLVWLGIAAAAFAVLLLITGNAIAALVLEALAAALVWVPHYLHGDWKPPAGTTRRQRMKNWWMALRLTLSDVRRQWYRLLDWVQHLRGKHTAAVPAPAAPRAPAPSPAGAVPSAAVPVLEPAVVDVTPAEIPPAFGPLLAHVREFEAAEDTELTTFTRGLAAGDLAYSEALEAQFEHCLTVIRLDPVALQGLADYADAKAEHAQGAMRIGQMINAVYAEVQAFRENGGVLPKDGDFLTGEA